MPSTPTSDFDEQHYGACSQVVSLAVGMSWINYGVAALVMISSVPNNYHAEAGLIVAVCIGFALSGRPVAALIRRITGWAQSTCYPLGILLGNALGVAAGASLASYLG
ncbi:hypothetical protein WDL1P2_00335 (plasmid) [Variovorax sp. WDL1]|nr:hypothetical protein [Variovorax sp. WDL1]PNG48753.1 hypothetical protein CHC06_06714 [Variovorax sp. B2]PNG49652.1 hypothetical protein CHC07_06561 [Variovorax sp. B4]VTV18668.1 hypothetical protein WDL1P2_00335 [Variovorax sp. WDL1]